MQVMITNRGTTPLPIGTTDMDGYEALLPPGLETAIPWDSIMNLAVGQKPAVTKREQLEGVGEGEASDELKEEYATDIDQWKGRSDPIADTAEMLVWIFVRNVGRSGEIISVQVGEQEMVALNNGDGQEFYGKDYALITSTGGTDPGPPDPPDPGDDTGTITGFTAANPTQVTMDSQDEAMLAIGGTITLEALTGDPAAMAAINGQSVAVLSKAPVTLDLDLTAIDVAALTADFVIDAGAPVP